MKLETIGTIARLTNLGFCPREIQLLARYSRAMSSLDTRSCNGDGWTGRGIWNDDDEARYEKKINSIRHKAQLLCIDAAARGHDVDAGAITAYHQSDPRGCALWIVTDIDLDGSDIRSAYTNGVAVVL